MEGDQGNAHHHVREEGLSLPLPGNFEGANSPAQAELWIRWYKKFSRYRYASGLHNKSQREQVKTILYAMGDSADDLLTTLHIDEDRATYEEVTEALNGYYHARKSTIAERAKFNRRCQKPGEPVEQFMQDLHRLAEDCEYSELREQLLRDRIGVLDDSLSDRLQSRPDLTLADAVRLARQDEARKQDRVLVRGDKSSTNVDYVKTKMPKGKGKQADKYKQQSQPQEKAFGWCGGARHQREKCPAKDKLCNRCQKKGHFAVVCRGSKTKRVQEIKTWKSHSSGRSTGKETTGQH